MLRSVAENADEDYGRPQTPVADVTEKSQVGVAKQHRRGVF
jgi:hypothetical protein